MIADRNPIKKVLITNPASSIKITKEGRVVMPLNISFETPRMPLSMALMAGGLERVAEVCVIDAVNEELAQTELQKRMHDFQPDLTIINCSTPTIQDDLAIVHDAKSMGSLTALFGQHADAIPREVMTDSVEIDFCFLREPEMIAGEFVQSWNDELEMSEVAGIAFLGAMRALYN